MKIKAGNINLDTEVDVGEERREDFLRKLQKFADHLHLVGQEDVVAENTYPNIHIHPKDGGSPILEVLINRDGDPSQLHFVRSTWRYQIFEIEGVSYHIDYWNREDTQRILAPQEDD